MIAMLNEMLKAAKNFNVWDYGFLKAYTVCFGIILGAYFSQFFLRYISLVWILFIVAMVWMFYKIFIKYRN